MLLSKLLLCLFPPLSYMIKTLVLLFCKFSTEDNTSVQGGFSKGREGEEVIHSYILFYSKISL